LYFVVLYVRFLNNKLISYN